MYFCISVSHLTLLYLFCQLNFNDGAITSGKNGTLVKTNKDSSVFITSRFGNDGKVTEQACKCVPFYTCDTENYFEIPNKPKACSGTSVCCKTETPDNLEIFTEISPVTITTSCQCVPRSQCQISSQEMNGVRLIDPKFLSTSTTDCDSNNNDVCCPNDKIVDLPVVDVTQLKCGGRKSVSDTAMSDPLNARVSGALNVRVSGSEDSTYTVFGEFPWMASIWKTTLNAEDEFVCGASLLSVNIILTAAHCMHQKDITTLKVRVGDYDINAQTSEESANFQEKSISSLITHPNYDSQTLFNDLAVVVTTEPFAFEQHISPICTSLLGSEFFGSQIYNSSKCIATGWGKSSSSSKAKLSTTLKKVELKIVPHYECQEKLRTTRLTKYFNLDSSFLCAGGVDGSDTCSGDGGGPLFCPLLSNNQQYVQVGVTSWGVGCGDDVPGVYASLEANNAWFLSTVRDQYKTTSDSSVSESDFRKKKTR